MTNSITVFTPTFNREHTIHRPYRSLQQQTYRNFKWVVVDDGSTDNTLKKLYDYKSIADFEVQVISQKNKGKFLTLIDVILNCDTDWLLIADSDDEFEPYALQRLVDAYFVVNQDDKNMGGGKFAGVSCQCKDSITQEIVGDLYPDKGDGYFISDVNRIGYVHHIRGEKWGILRTAVLKEIIKDLPLPKYSVYLSENMLWSSIANKYDTIFINDVLRIYYQGTSDTLSVNNIAKKYPFGAWFSERIILKNTYRYYFHDIKGFSKTLVKINYAALLSEKSVFETIKTLPILCKFLVLLYLPMGYLARIIYK